MTMTTIHIEKQEHRLMKEWRISQGDWFISITNAPVLYALSPTQLLRFQPDGSIDLDSPDKYYDQYHRATVDVTLAVERKDA